MFFSGVYSKHDATVTGTDFSMGPPIPFVALESPTNVSAGIGTRVVFGQDRVLPFARVGLMYQYLADDLIDDSGLGYYFGAGVDFRLDEQTTIGPHCRYGSTARGLAGGGDEALARLGSGRRFLCWTSDAVVAFQNTLP